VTFFIAAEEDFDACDVLLDHGNRLAAFHMQQGIEKLIRAELAARAILAGIDHNLKALADKLPSDAPIRQRFKAFEHYSAYATAFRYPKPGGGLPNPPNSKVLREHLTEARSLAKEMRSMLLAS
jgi:HEPN domain-containing protein